MFQVSMIGLDSDGVRRAGAGIGGMKAERCRPSGLETSVTLSMRTFVRTYVLYHGTGLITPW